MRKKIMASVISACMVITLTTALCGCGRKESPAAPQASAPDAESAAAAEPRRADGERFEAAILLEGMEEMVHLEHIRNETLGFELDYDYEALVRYSEAERERFISCYETPENAWNYLDIQRDTGNAELVASAVSAALSEKFGTVEMQVWTLENAGECLRIEASGGREDFSALQTVYIVPAGEGCLIAATHCTFESAEGFGARFDSIMNTLSLIAG